METETTFSKKRPLTRIIKIAVLLLCAVTILIICLRIIGYGYYPQDDALRHVAKVISGKEWNDILVLRDEIKTDSHPGWHTLLGFFYKTTGSSQTNLLNFSIIFLFLLYMMPPAFFFRRPEAWITSLAVLSVFSFGPFFRIFYGRPFIFSMFLILIFCFLWKRIRDRDKPYHELILFTLLTALSTWIHGTWYLLSLPLAALLFAREWRVFALMGLSTFLGTVIGALVTGQPLAFLHQMLFHALEAFGQHDFTRQLVTEFRPFSGDAMALVVIAGLLIWRQARGDWNTKCIDNPVFILGVLGWIMGFVAVRFWTDWGFAALAFWVALEFHQIFEKYLNEFSMKRIAVTMALCLVLFLAMTSDWGSRWSGRVMAEWPKMENDEQVSWLPEDGGILYSDNMMVFYNIFYNNPHGPWRYILGFEPIWMPKEDLEIYRNIQLSDGKAESFTPWIKKMTEKDRMILIRTKEPKTDELEWHETTPTVWSGRVKILQVNISTLVNH